jgi:hypothetical protein
MKGVNSISREGILNVYKNDKDYRIQFQALSFVKDKLQITDLSGNVISEFNIDLEPEQIFIQAVSLKNDQVKFRLAEGELKYDMSDKEANFIDRPLTIPKILTGNRFTACIPGVSKNQGSACIPKLRVFLRNVWRKIQAICLLLPRLLK